MPLKAPNKPKHTLSNALKPNENQTLVEYIESENSVVNYYS